MKRILQLILVTLFLYSCKTIEAVQPEVSNQPIPVSEQNSSIITVPIEMNLKPYFDDVEKNTPKKFTGKEENCEGVSYNYIFLRSPINIAGKKDEFEFSINGKYGLSVVTALNVSPYLVMKTLV